MQDESKANLLFSLHNERRHNEHLRKQLEQAREEIDRLEKEVLDRQIQIDSFPWSEGVVELEEQNAHYRQALEEITRQYDDTSVNRAKEIARKALEVGQSEN